jgi:hypothetical protein
MLGVAVWAFWLDPDVSMLERVQRDVAEYPRAKPPTGGQRAESRALLLSVKEGTADRSNRSTRLPHPVAGSFRDLARPHSDAKAREVAFRVA